MAYTSTSTVLLTLLVLSAASSAIHCATVLGQVVGQVTVGGSVVCATNTSVVAAGVPGLNTSVSFNGGQVALGEAITDANGDVSISVKTQGVAVLDPSTGIATVNVPSGVCRPAATVIVPLSLLRITITPRDAEADFSFPILRMFNNTGGCR